MQPSTACTPTKGGTCCSCAAIVAATEVPARGEMVWGGPSHCWCWSTGWSTGDSPSVLQHESWWKSLHEHAPGHEEANAEAVPTLEEAVPLSPAMERTSDDVRRLELLFEDGILSKREFEAKRRLLTEPLLVQKM